MIPDFRTNSPKRTPPISWSRRTSAAWPGSLTRASSARIAAAAAAGSAAAGDRPAHHQVVRARAHRGGRRRGPRLIVRAAAGRADARGDDQRLRPEDRPQARRLAGRGHARRRTPPRARGRPAGPRAPGPRPGTPSSRWRAARSRLVRTVTATTRGRSRPAARAAAAAARSMARAARGVHGEEPDAQPRGRLARRPPPSPGCRGT